MFTNYITNVNMVNSFCTQLQYPYIVTVLRFIVHIIINAMNMCRVGLVLGLGLALWVMDREQPVLKWYYNHVRYCKYAQKLHKQQTFCTSSRVPLTSIDIRVFEARQTINIVNPLSTSYLNFQLTYNSKTKRTFKFYYVQIQ